MIFRNLILFFTLITFLASCTSTKKSTAVINDKNPSEKGISNKNKEDVKLEQLFVEACHLRIVGETQQALNLFNQCLQENPDNDAILYEIASIYNTTKDYNKAAEYIANAIKLNPANKWYKSLSIDIYENLGKYDQAAELASELANQYPDNLDYQFDRAYFLSKAHEYEKAISVYNQIENKTGVIENVSVEKQKLWSNLNKPEKAIDEIVKLKNANPSEPKYVAMLADLYLANGMNDKAFDAIQQLAQLDSTNSQAQFVVADYYYKQGKWDEAFVYAQRAFRDPAANIDNKIQVVLSYFPFIHSNESRKQQALSLTKLLAQVHSSEAKALAVYGDVLNQAEMDKEALEAYKKSVSIDGSKFMVWEQILYLESRMQQNDSLIKTSQQVIELFPDQPLAYYYNGIAKEHSKKYPEAINSFNRVLMMGVEDNGLRSQIYASLGDCYHFMDNNSASDSCFNQSIVADPSNVYALNNYSFYLAKRGEKLEEAERMSYKVVTALATEVPTYLDTYAWVLYKEKKYSEARTWIEKAISKTKENSAEILDHYGDILFQLGETDNAIQQWKKARAAGADDKTEKKINDRRLYE